MSIPVDSLTNLPASIFLLSNLLLPIAFFNPWKQFKEDWNKINEKEAKEEQQEAEEYVKRFNKPWPGRAQAFIDYMSVEMDADRRFDALRARLGARFDFLSSEEKSRIAQMNSGELARFLKEFETNFPPIASGPSVPNVLSKDEEIEKYRAEIRHKHDLERIEHEEKTKLQVSKALLFGKQFDAMIDDQALRLQKIDSDPTLSPETKIDARRAAETTFIQQIDEFVSTFRE